MRGRMRRCSIAFVLLVALGFAPASAATSREVFSGSGTVRAPYCDTCEELVDYLDAQYLPGTAPDTSPNGIGTYEVPGALANGANWFQLSKTSQVGSANLAITFYNAKGFPVGHFEWPGDEAGAIPSTSATVVIELVKGAQAGFVYHELIRR